MADAKVDTNGYVEILDVAIARSGVLECLGETLICWSGVDDGSIDRAETYNVYRPPEELRNAECIDSFKLLPWVIEHTMLGAIGDPGSEETLIHGVIGENVVFDGQYLRANVKIFSSALADAIDFGTRELSIGYSQQTILTPVVIDGVQCAGVQQKIRGNHLASVPTGRAGSDVAVPKFFNVAIDSADLKITRTEEKKQMSEDRLQKIEDRLEEVVKMLATLSEAEKSEAEAAEDAPDLPDDADKKAEDEDGPDADKKAEDEDDPDADKKAEDEDDPDADKPKPAMDAVVSELSQMRARLNRLEKQKLTPEKVYAEIAKKKDLADKLSWHIGAFDHAEKSYPDVLAYGVKKLGIKCARGEEASAISGFLEGLKKAEAKTASAFDHAAHKVSNSQIADYLKAAV